ncbi:MAG: 4-(cytidine 5-diphospho)-2-C-methyl-D-erythritol kinase [Verrucomicrobiota bacterium]|jgi:4-diphosphocytidyl-2-C-methyl-D-erythritol kinase
MIPRIHHAPAKLNLSLRVLGKRADGFHDIDTLMVKLPELADHLEFRPSETFSFSCDAPDVPGDDRNLVVKAVRAYESATGIPCCYAITLKKIIPHGAGLGGGSSDAATTLLALNQLHAHPLDSPRLLDLAASLGSDVPFFLTPGAARCSGRGEIIAPEPAPPPARVLLLKPSFCVPTPDAYARWINSLELPGIRYTPQKINSLLLVNDLERPVFAKHRFLAELKHWLLNRRETTAALLCGSGSTVFAVLRHDADPTAIAKAARHELDPGLWHWAGSTGT